MDETHVDNILQFRSYIQSRLTNDGDFFQLLFMTRKKDGHPKTEIIGFKYLYSVKDLDDNTEYIKDKCMKRNARCYIKVNKRNDEIVSANLVIYIVDKHLRKDYQLLPGAYSHAVGVSPVSENKLVVVDIDNVDQYDSVINELNRIKSLKRMSPREECFITVKTKNGIHVLVPPFDISEFNKTFKDINVLKDAESLLFY